MSFIIVRVGRNDQKKPSIRYNPYDLLRTVATVVVVVYIATKLGKDNRLLSHKYDSN